jgi:ABC-type transport system involved in multi-copper enzyme maturation permease subunit
MSLLIAAWINELEKLWRHRRVLILVITGMVIAAAALSTLSTMASGSWQSAELDAIHRMQQMVQTPVPNGQTPTGGLVFDLNSSIRQGIALREYRLAHQLAPVDWYPISAASKTVFQLVFPLYLLLAGWLAAESLAQERADGTLTSLLSLPIPRLTVLAAKAGAVLTTTLAAILLGWLVSYAAYGLVHGGWLRVAQDVALLKNPSLPGDASNLRLIPAWWYAGLSLALASLGLAAGDALGMLVSTVARSTGWSVGTTLGALLLPPGALVVVGLWLHSPAWIQWLPFSHLQPAGLLIDQAAPGIASSSIFTTIAVLMAWTALMITGALVAFHFKDELA